MPAVDCLPVRIDIIVVFPAPLVPVPLVLYGQINNMSPIYNYMYIIWHHIVYTIPVNYRWITCLQHVTSRECVTVITVYYWTRCSDFSGQLQDFFVVYSVSEKKVPSLLCNTLLRCPAWRKSLNATRVNICVALMGALIAETWQQTQKCDHSVTRLEIIDGPKTFVFHWFMQSSELSD